MTEEKLTHKQALFVLEYLVDLNATQAAIRAGYSEQTAYAMGAENLRKPQIDQMIKKQMDKRAAKIKLSAEYVLEKIIEVVERCSQGVPVTDKDGNPIGEWRFNASAVLKGTEQLGRHLAMFVDRSEVTHNLGDATEQLRLARERLAAAKEAKLIESNAIISKERGNGRSLQQ